MLSNLLFFTEDDPLLLTIADTDHGQDLVPTVHDAIDNGIVAVKDFFPPNFLFSFFFLNSNFLKLFILPIP